MEQAEYMAEQGMCTIDECRQQMLAQLDDEPKTWDDYLVDVDDQEEQEKEESYDEHLEDDFEKHEEAEEEEEEEEKDTEQDDIQEALDQEDSDGEMITTEELNEDQEGRSDIVEKR